MIENRLSDDEARGREYVVKNKDQKDPAGQQERHLEMIIEQQLSPIHNPPLTWARRLAIAIPPGSRNPASRPMTIPPTGPVKLAPRVVNISLGSVTTPDPGIGIISPASTMANAATPKAAATRRILSHARGWIFKDDHPSPSNYSLCS